MEGWEGAAAEALKGFHCTPSSEMCPAKTIPGKRARQEETDEETAGIGIISVRSSQAGTHRAQIPARSTESEYSLQDLSGCS